MAVGRRRKQASGRPQGVTRRGRLLPYILILPALVFELIVHVIPILLGLWASLTSLTQLTIRDWTTAPIVWLQNYRNGLDPDGPIGAAVWASFLRTAVFAVLVVSLAWGIGMLAAYLLSTDFRGRAALRAFFLVPFALPAFVGVIGWSFMFNRDSGAINHLIVDNLGLLDEKPFWLIGGNAFWAVVVVSAWRLWPFAFLMLLAALQNVPVEIYEAGTLDGASRWQQFRRIILPIIRPMNAVIVLVMGLSSFNEFTVPYVLFGTQPPESATLLSNLIYDHAFVNFNMGIGAAVNVLVLLFLLGISAVYVRLVFPGWGKHA